MFELLNISKIKFKSLERCEITINNTERSFLINETCLKEKTLAQLTNIFHSDNFILSPNNCVKKKNVQLCKHILVQFNRETTRINTSLENVHVKIQVNLYFT